MSTANSTLDERTGTFSLYKEDTSPATTQFYAKSLSPEPPEYGTSTLAEWINVCLIVKKGETYTITVNNSGNSTTSIIKWREIEIGV